MECVQCYKVFTRSDNLRRHMKIHDRHQPYPNVKLLENEKPYPNLKRQDSEVKDVLQLPRLSLEVLPFTSQKQFSDDQDEDRVDRSEVLSGDIDDLIDKIKNEEIEIWRSKY